MSLEAQIEEEKITHESIVSQLSDKKIVCQGKENDTATLSKKYISRAAKVSRGSSKN